MKKSIVKLFSLIMVIAMLLPGMAMARAQATEIPATEQQSEEISIVPFYVGPIYFSNATLYETPNTSTRIGTASGYFYIVQTVTGWAGLSRSAYGSVFGWVRV